MQEGGGRGRRLLVFVHGRTVQAITKRSVFISGIAVVFGGGGCMGNAATSDGGR